jgi:hypothetical protein
MSETFRIHYLVPAATGPVKSAPGGDVVKIGSHGRFVVACDPNLTMSDADRGTGETWGVRCKKCIATEIFKRNRRPKPGQRSADFSEVVDNGCCG